MDTWHQVKREIEELHRQRKKEGTEEVTKKGIDLFIQFLFLSNDKPYSFHDSPPLDDLEVKPVNLKERLDFILARPSLFPSYIQLCELMVEQEKLFAKKMIKKKGV